MGKDGDVDAFRKCFNFFKSYRGESQSNYDIIDFDSPKFHHPNIEHCDVKSQFSQENFSNVGLRHPTTWKLLKLKGTSGFYFIVNPFLKWGSAFWVQKCLIHYTDSPNFTNLSGSSAGDQIWEKSVPLLTNKRFGQPKTLIEQLRWATLGYHYNWTTRKYYSDNCSPFPSELQALSRIIAASVGFHEYNAEAAIVNFYPLKSTLGIHKDEVELDAISPLISFSFGKSAIFLLGSSSKSEEPMPLLVRPGDILVMHGKSRHAYHALPVILANNDASALNPNDFEDLSEIEKEAIDNYIADHRINISVRQVFNTPSDIALLEKHDPRIL